MNIQVSKKNCTNCGIRDFDRNQIIYYNKGAFCNETCKSEDIRKSEIHSPTINYITKNPPRTLMMNSTSGRI